MDANVNTNVTEEGEKKKRKRSVNFNGSEVDLIVSEYGKVKERLDGSSKFKVTNEDKAKIWRDIAQRVTLLGYSVRSADEVKNKWGNLQREAKDANMLYNKEMRKTGGGPPVEELDTNQQTIVNMFSEDTAFNGIAGAAESTIAGFHQRPMHVPVSPVMPMRRMFMNTPATSTPVKKTSASPDNDVAQSEQSTCQTQSCDVTEAHHSTRKRQKLSQEDVWKEQIRFCQEQRETSLLEREKISLQIEVLRLIKDNLQRERDESRNITVTELLASMQ